MAPKAPSQPHSLVRDGLREAVSHLVLHNAIAKCNGTLIQITFRRIRGARWAENREAPP
jgi:hypothetical protein